MNWQNLLHWSVLAAIGMQVAAGGVVYVCDATVTAVAPAACDTLNTTTAGLYSAAFTNANANIYVTLGNAGLANSVSTYNLFAYSEFQNRLAASAAGGNDATALAVSAGPVNPLGTTMVAVTNALQRALGLSSPLFGVTPDGGTCRLLRSSACYDGLITVSSVQPLFFRVGTILRTQYDFYSLVEHETDEILGTSSCVFNDCSGGSAPADFFRYHSNGARAVAAGSNDACSASSTANACFSIDATHMLQQYNNINNGLDAGDWVTDCAHQLVQDAQRCPGTSGVDISPAAEILVLDVVGYTLTNPPAAPFSCTNTATPLITSIDSASGYGGYSYFSSGSWLEIKGTNLADPADPRLTQATGAGQWAASDFTGSNAPTALDGISVSIDGIAGFVSYISAGQINVQAPQDSASGNVSITVTNCHATSSAFPFKRQTLAPGLLAPPNYAANGTQYMVATFASDGAYVLNTSAGTAFGLASRPAKPGDTIIAYGVGFGGVTPTLAPGVIDAQIDQLTNPVAFSFGSAPASLLYSGLAPNFVGLYEFYITVPLGLANGDYKINVTQGGTAVPQTMYLTVHN